MALIRRTFCDTPSGLSICLLSSSGTIVMAEHALKHVNLQEFQNLVGHHDSARRRVSAPDRT